MQRNYTIEQTDKELLNSSANINYTISFQNAAQHLVKVVLKISAITTPTLQVVMPSWTPGSYKIRDYAAFQGNLIVRASGTNNSLQSNWLSKATLEIQTNGNAEIEVEYLVYAHERSVRTNHVNSTHAFLMLTGICMYVEGRLEEVHHITFTDIPASWKNISTALSPVRTGTFTFGALNYDILADSPVEIGNHEVRRFRAVGAEHEVALVSQDNTYEIDWLIPHLKRIVEVEAQIFGGVPYDRYVFIIQLYPGLYGGLEHARSSVNLVTPAAFSDKTKMLELLALICHEYFHLWNVKRIRPIELGPFDYTTETYTEMLWLAEGLTSYYDDLLAYRCKFSTAEEYLEIIGKDHLTKLGRVPGRTRMSVKDSSKLAWLKLYAANPDGNNRFPSYYLKGGVIFLLLDLYIIEHTDGRFCLDDVVRGLWKRYQENPSIGVTEEECIAIIERSTGVQIRERLQSWLNGTQELPYAELFEKVGIEIQTVALPTTKATFGEGLPMPATKQLVFTGMVLGEIDSRVAVRWVEDGSPAFEAGVGIDDEIIAINGVRVHSAQRAEQLLAFDLGKAVTVLAQRDSSVFTTSVTPKPLQTISLKKMEKPSTSQKKLQSVWLQRLI